MQLLNTDIRFFNCWFFWRFGGLRWESHLIWTGVKFDGENISILDLNLSIYSIQSL